MVERDYAFEKRIVGIMQQMAFKSCLEANEPVDMSTDAHGNRKKYKLQYVRAFPHAQVEIAQAESDRTNPRYGHPTMYRIQFQPHDIADVDGFVDLSVQDVHWTRIIHIADNREVSEIYGVPRLQRVFNSLLDLQKVFGSSGEMFYKGAYGAADFVSNTICRPASCSVFNPLWHG